MDILFVLFLDWFIDVLPLLLLIVHVWCFCFLLMPIDLYLLIEEGSLHYPVASCIKFTIAVNEVTIKGCRQPPSRRVNTSSDDKQLQHPQECSDDSVDITASGWEHCSEVDKPQRVVTVPSLHKELNKELLPPVVTLEQFNAQVCLPALREVAPFATIIDTSLPSYKQHDDTRYEDISCDNNEPEDKEDSRSVATCCCDDCNIGEVFLLQRPMLRQSSTQSDTLEDMMPIVKKGHTVIEGDSSFAPGVEKAGQNCVDQELDNDNEYELSTSTMPSTSN